MRLLLTRTFIVLDLEICFPAVEVGKLVIQAITYLRKRKRCGGDLKCEHVISLLGINFYIFLHYELKRDGNKKYEIDMAIRSTNL